MANENEVDRDSTPRSAKRRDKPLSALDRVVAQAIGEGKVLGLADDPARTTFPNLWEWMTRVYYGIDRIKQPAIVTVVAVNGGFTVRCADRELASAVQVTVRHLDDAWRALEAALADPSVPIQTWGRKEPKLRKRQKES